MKHHFLLSFLTYLLCASCSEQTYGTSTSTETHRDSTSTATYSTDTSRLYSITEVNAEDFLKARKRFKDCILYNTASFRKRGDTLKILTDNPNQPYVLFTDTLLNTDDTYLRIYKYVGQFAEQGIFIIEFQYYEGNEFILLDKQTNVQTTIWDKPKLSPNKQFIANLSPTYGMDGLPNGLQVWRINNKGEGLSNVINIDQEVWVPYDFFWETNNTLLLQVSSVENYLEGQGQIPKDGGTFLRITIK